MTEKTLFIKFLGDSPKIRVLDLLLTGRGLDYSISDIAEQSGISRSTFYKMMDELLQNQIIKPTNKYGNIQLYRLNQENKYVKKLITMFDQLLFIASEKEINRQTQLILREKKAKYNRIKS